MVVRAKVGCDGKGGVKGGEEEGEGEEEGCHVFLFAELDRVGIEELKLDEMRDEIDN